MSTLTDNEKQYLLKLAYSTIFQKLSGKKGEDFKEPESSVINEKRGCFVTLHLDNSLRGCIGNIEPVYKLIKGIKKNALNAAFSDPRFTPLSLEEFRRVEIEISILTVPEELVFSSEKDLLQKLKPQKHGVIISKKYHSATYLPQVWEQLPDKKDFLSNLCIKAGLEKNAWKERNITIKTYSAEYFS